MKKRLGIAAVLLGLVVFDTQGDAQQTRAQQYSRPVVLAHGDDHFFFVDQPLSNQLFSRVQTYGETRVHWVKVRVDPKSSGVFSIEQKIVTSNL